ncbi:Retrovirus-related Pol polyprotein from transposon RE2 [Vitis vinifera]|uniref:Retrovirus-related Pol polyprotein from transposon RE2 n=1 Tax=Vitis vinifera TaxID=29760 RepID=A0A438C9I2_VITVI|nr:Retrovirus-related Pol polyprotein from transposon RE2 [Vitis vinifera]
MSTFNNLKDSLMLKRPSYVRKLNKVLYGLRQAPRFWFQELRNFLLSTSYFLGIETFCIDGGLFLSQHKYILELHHRTHILDSKEVSTPMSSTDPLRLHDGSPPADATTYRQTLGALQYLSMTCLDISFTVNKLSSLCINLLCNIGPLLSVSLLFQRDLYPWNSHPKVAKHQLCIFPVHSVDQLVDSLMKLLYCQTFLVNVTDWRP